MYIYCNIIILYLKHNSSAKYQILTEYLTKMTCISIEKALTSLKSLAIAN